MFCPQAAQLCVNFLSRKNNNAAPPLWTCLRTHYWGQKGAQHPAGIKPTTSRVLLHRPALYCCATTAALKKWKRKGSSNHVEKRTRAFGLDFNAIKYVQVEPIKNDVSPPENNITALIKESSPGSGSQTFSKSEKSFDVNIGLERFESQCGGDLNERSRSKCHNMISSHYPAGWGSITELRRRGPMPILMPLEKSQFVTVKVEHIVTDRWTFGHSGHLSSLLLNQPPKKDVSNAPN